eukprot:7877943-Alexandrium_andersonii.AAC.1
MPTRSLFAVADLFRVATCKLRTSRSPLSAYSFFLAPLPPLSPPPPRPDRELARNEPPQGELPGGPPRRSR